MGWHAAAVEAAELLDDLEQEYGADVEVGRVMVIVEVSGDVGTEDEWTGVHFRCTDGKRWIQAGLLAAAQRAVDSSSEPRDSGDDG